MHGVRSGLEAKGEVQDEEEGEREGETGKWRNGEWDGHMKELRGGDGWVKSKGGRMIKGIEGRRKRKSKRQRNEGRRKEGRRRDG